MSYDKTQFRSLIGSVLVSTDPKLASVSAINLLLGTAAVESEFGTYLRQIKGPALGAFQMEPATFNWLKSNYGVRYGVEDFFVEELEYNLRVAILMARLRYLVIPPPLPDHDDIPGLGLYWKEHYNTIAGAGTVQKFVAKYHQYVSPV